MRKIHSVIVVAVVALLTLACQTSKPPAAPLPNRSAAARLTELYAGPGVMLRGPENCISDKGDPWADPATVNFCAVKDVFGALGGPSSGAAPTDFVKTANRFEFSQPTDCPKAGGRRRQALTTARWRPELSHCYPPDRRSGCSGCAPKRSRKTALCWGTITDPNWAPEGVYLLMDPAKVHIHVSTPRTPITTAVTKPTRSPQARSDRCVPRMRPTPCASTVPTRWSRCWPPQRLLHP